MRRLKVKKIFRFVGILMILMLFAFQIILSFRKSPRNIHYSTFLEWIAIQKVMDVELTTGGDEVRGTDTDGGLFYVIGPPENPYSDPGLLKVLKEYKVRVLLDYREIK